MRHVSRTALRAATAVAAALALAACVPQPPETATVAEGSPSTSAPAASATSAPASSPAAPTTSATTPRTTPPATTQPSTTPPSTPPSTQPPTTTAPSPTSTSPSPTTTAPTTPATTRTTPPEATSSPPAPASPLPSVPLAPPPASEYAAPAPTPVLPSLAQDGGRPTTAGLTRVLGPLLRDDGLGDRVVVDVADAATGTALLTRGASTPAVPASTTKVLTAVAALSVLGPQERLATSVVQGDDDTVVLVAGGDMLVAAGRGDAGDVVGHAGLADLADATAAALAAAGRTAVTLRLDDTVFSGARVSPGWKPADLTAGFVAPVAPLAVENGRALTGKPATSKDPALAAAKMFARLLEERDVDVRGGVTRGTAPDGVGAFARVLGAPVSDVVEHMLDESDNTVAEVLARLVAVRTGRPGTFEGAGEAVLAAVGELGVPTGGARFEGGSGLARDGVIAPRTLTAALELAASPDHPELRATLTGLPVAGVTGTLADRYTATDQRRGVGVVRAKTGTLTGASSLAGVVVDADGRLLAFAVLADRVGATGDARDVLDSIASALAGCGCS